ncbi:hypothetical protein GPJ56_007778 [Histomonas meleagridis]|uniref:uncharacterized protein n=1 Tax=Histomonas meleagridis TaxID=135588 RepID=UPI00355A3BA8|nr:hypothetical protein GPJ56_007778 [Histomonas meleagridis]KAH0798743.1 hypothetical protein GO595_008608 [Histomonas meleagridis]
MSSSDLERNDETNNDFWQTSKATAYEEALFYLYPESFIEANSQKEEQNQPKGIYCTFCGKFLASSSDVKATCTNPYCRKANGNTSSYATLNQMIGKEPKRTTNPLVFD